MVATIDSTTALETAFPELTNELQADITNVCKMLADGSRLKIVFFLLRHPELNVTEMCERLNQSQPAVSHHLALLKSAKLLTVRRDGKHNYYSVCRSRFQQVMVKLFESIVEGRDPESKIPQALLERFSS